MKTTRDDDPPAAGTRLHEDPPLFGATRTQAGDALVVTRSGETVDALPGTGRLSRAFLDALHEGVVIVDASGRVTWANQAFARLVGWPIETLLGTESRHLFTAPVMLSRAVSTLSQECDLLAADGRPIPVAVSLERTHDDTDAVAAVVRDLSERGLLHRLRERDERMRLAAEATGFGVYDVNPRTRQVVWSRQLKRVFEMADDTVEDPALMESRVHPDDRERYVAEKQRAYRMNRPGQHEIEFRILRENGEVRWLHDTARFQVDVIDGEPTVVRVVGTVLDVTERRRVQEVLTARTRQLDCLARTSQRLLLTADPGPELLESLFQDVARVIDMEMFFHYRPASEERLLHLSTSGGVSPEEQRLFATMRFGDLLCGWVAEHRERLIVEDLQHSSHPGSDVLRLAGVTSYAGFPLLTNGELVGTIAFTSRRRTHLSDGDVQMIQAICDQVATTLERSRLQRDARASEERARLALEGADLGSWDVDVLSGATVWSRRHAELLGQPPDVPPSMTRWQALVHPEDLPRVLTDMDRARLARVPFVVEHRLREADTGEERWLGLFGRYFYDASGQPVRLSGVSRDVTARQQADAERRAAAEALRASEARFRRASEVVGALVYDTDLAGSTPAIVHGLEAVVGESWGAATSEAWHARIHPDDLPGHRARLRDAVDSGTRRWVDRYRVRHADGSWRHVEDVAEIVRTPDSTATRLVGTILDVTERVEQETALAESEARFRAMADQTPVVMWVTSPRGDIEFVNQAYCVFFGVTLDDVRGPNWRPLVHPEDDGYVSAFADALVTQRPFQAAARAKRADGEWRWIESIGHPRYANGVFVGMIGVSSDVTDQRRASELARKAAREKDDFIAVLAHELRNPLAPIRTAVSVLRAAGPAVPHLAKCRDIIDRQVSQMARLLDDLLDVSRLSQGKLTLQRATVPVRDVVDIAAETVRPLVDDREHTLTIDEIPPALMIDADPARLAQVFINLLNNAAKYTNRHGQITLTVEERNGCMVFRVRDNGIGIRPEMRERIFELFTQTEDAQPRADGGLGIGLGLTRRLVELHGGTITAESLGVDQGSTFTVTLPLDAHAQTTASRPDTRKELAAPAHSSRRRVLVVDDNADAADTLTMLLEAIGCEVCTAYDGESALQKASSFQPDLVLLDLGMPHLSGQVVCQRLRAETWGAHVVIAAVTGWGQEEDRRRTRAAGFDHHLVKPVDPEMLTRLVRELPPPLTV